jgi:glycyl-tRNA synthetase beta chain
MPRLVFEIGTEEIPARFLVGAVEQLKSLAVERLGAARLGYGEVKTYATPRRLTLVVENLAGGQESRMREESGPPAEKGFAADGTPTQAAVGFARRWGLEVKDLQRKDTPKGPYLLAVFREEGKGAAEVLQELLPVLAGALYFPKTMRWGTGTFRFGRPVRWLLALLDGAVIDFEIDGLRSGRETRGHPTLYPKPLTVGAAQDYEAALKKGKVMLDQAARRRTLARQLKNLAKQEGARIADSDDLLAETVYLVEWPTAVVGGFDERYLALPRPVLVEEMKKVQGYFPLENGEGKLIARFIGVRDGGTAHLDIVRAGYEGVLRAKFEDASFFFEHDKRKRLEERVEQLKGVAYLAGMGSLYDKALRLKELAGFIADKAGLGEEEEAAVERAAWLAKADLVTDLVVEINSLQGTMGGEYARISGEAEPVALAIGEHYRPRFGGDALPSTMGGRIVALADKLDTICSGLAAGLSVSGSEDPYGLRREGQAVISLLNEIGLRLPLKGMIRQALRALEGKANFDADRTGAKVQELLHQRLERLLKDSPPAGRGIRYDLADAVLGAGWDDVGDAVKRGAALQKLSGRKDFLPTVVASTRPANIVKGFAGGEPEAALFQDKEEGTLWQACLGARAKIEHLAKAGDYVGLFAVLAALRPTIDDFFEKVLVMAADPQVKNNRLALVWQVDRLFRHLADFRLVVQENTISAKS